MNLFDEEEITLPLKDGQFIYYPKFLNEELASELFNSIYQETNWKKIRLQYLVKKYFNPDLQVCLGMKANLILIQELPCIQIIGTNHYCL